jgi:coenzyme F420-0:L-glutamate ligase
MKVKAIKTRIFKEKENLLDFIISHVKKLENNSILVITSKIVALSEGRVFEIKNIKTKEELIKKESDFVMKTKYAWLTIKDGMVLASAGVDESNANGKIILLPKDSFKTAEVLRKKLLKHYGIKNLGVLITDSRLLPLRAGSVGVALGYSGFKGIRDYRGKLDLFKRKLKVSGIDIADSLATSAVMLMGEGNERQPLALITDSNVVFVKKINKNELKIDIKDDLYYPVIKSLFYEKKK